MRSLRGMQVGDNSPSSMDATPAPLWHPEEEFNQNLDEANYYHDNPPVEKKKDKIDPYFAMHGIQNGASWLSGIVDRNRQNQYMQQQYATLGQLDAMPTSNFQPNPFSLYAQYGGSIKKFQAGGRTPITVTNPSDPRLKAYSDSLSLYNKNRINAKKDGLNVDKVLPLVGNEGEKNADKKTGIRPVGMYAANNLDEYNAYWSAFKKPVQPVVYQKPSTRTVEYTDPLKFKQAQKAYSDSLLTYNNLEQGYKESINYLKSSNSKNEFADANKKAMQRLPVNESLLYEIPTQTLGKKAFKDGDIQIITRGWGAKKPVVKPVLKEQLFPLQPAVKGSMKVTVPQQEQIPEPTGQPVYGPSNGLIGYQTKNGFQPTLRRDHLAKNNQADIDLLNSPEALQKYVTSTPRYRKGGMFRGKR